MPEFGGFNKSLAREHCQSAIPGTLAIYTLLIDMTPSGPDTIMTAMTEAQKLAHEAKQEITIFTNDQQLYKEAVNFMWVYPEQFNQLNMGGAHVDEL